MKVGDLGLIGLGVMGANLALNFERNGYVVAVYNRKERDKMSYLVLWKRMEKIKTSYRPLR